MSLDQNDAVLVTGAGTIGLLTLYRLRWLGLKNVDVLEPLPERRDLALTLGARAVSAPETLSEGARYDAGVECSSRQAAFAKLQRHLKPDGQICVLADGNLEPLTLLPEFHARELRIVASSAGRTIRATRRRFSLIGRRREHLWENFSPGVFRLGTSPKRSSGFLWTRPSRCSCRTDNLRRAKCRATLADLEEVLGLFDAVQVWLVEKGLKDQWGDVPFPASEAQREMFAAWLRAGDFRVVRHDGRIVGTLEFSAGPPEYARPASAGRGRSGYLEAFAVRRDHAGRGVGAALLGWAVEEAVRRSLEILHLDCWAENGALHAYYRRAGFQEVATLSLGAWRGTLFEKVLKPPPP